jgi:parvulin-like peptidyl-prolyl isomerase
LRAQWRSIDLEAELAMIDTLRLARRWKEAQNDPERMVEALSEELGEETSSKADLRSFEGTIRAEFDSFRAEIRAELDSFKAEMRAELDSFKVEMRAELETFKATIRAEMASFKNQVLGAQLAMFIALVALILYRTSS